MEALTMIKEIGTELKAWCPGCHEWIDDVEVVENCHPSGRTYIFCPYCMEAIARSE